MEFTEKQISAVARVLSDRSAYDCGVHKDDNWQVYGEDYLESAKAALAVFSAAAPQVVADERKGSPYPEYDRGFSNGWDACAKREAAPVQAQEPVAETYAHTMSNGRGRPDDPAPFETVCVRLLRNDLPADLKLYAAPVQAQELSDATIINAANKYGISPHAAMPFVRELIASQSTVKEIRAVANPVEFDGIKTHAVRAQEPIGYASSNELRNLSDPGTSRLIAICASPVQPDVTVALYSAPVQPVAVPDGPYTFPIGEDGEYMILDKDGQQVGTVLYYHAAKVIAAALAAPAAQGDALIESNLREIIAKTSDDYARYVARTTLAAIAAKAAS